jgi:hypothetical protein
MRAFTLNMDKGADIGLAKTGILLQGLLTELEEDVSEVTITGTLDGDMVQYEVNGMYNPAYSFTLTGKASVATPEIVAWDG